MNDFHFLTILLLFMIAGSFATAEVMKNASELTIVGEEYAPFSYLSEGALAGSSVDLIKEIADDAAIPLNKSGITLYPWEEAYNTTVNGSNTILLAVYRTPEREALMRWVGPIATDSSAVFVNNNTTLVINSSEDLKNLKIGVVSGDAHEGMLKGYGVGTENITTAHNVSALIPLIQDGSIDAIFHGEMAGLWAIREVTRDADSLPVAIRINEQKVWFGLSPDTPSERVNALQASLEKTQASQAINITV